MKNKINVSKMRLIGIIALTAVNVFASCDNGTTKDSPNRATGSSSVYIWADSTNTYQLTITESGSRSAVTSGNYTLVIVNITTGVTKTSTGTAAAGSGGQITLSNTGGTPITITINDTTITIPQGAEIYISASNKIPMGQGTMEVAVVEGNAAGGSFSVKNEQVYIRENNTLFTGSGKVYMGYFIEGSGQYEKVEIGTMTNGKLTFTVPSAAAPEKFLQTVKVNVTNETSGTQSWTYTNKKGSITANPGNVKIAAGNIIFIDSTDQEEYHLYYITENMSTSYGMGYTYSDKNAAISGTMSFRETYQNSAHPEENEIRDVTISYNITLSKGWNIFYQAQSPNSLSVSNTVPSGATGMKWVISVN